MKVMGKTLKQYFRASWKFLAVIFIIMAIIVAIRLSFDFASGIQTLLTLFGVILIGWAGWSAVKGHGFNLKQAGIVGILLSFGTHWALPIFHSMLEVIFLILINTIIYSVIAVFGGWLVKKFKK